MSYDYGMHNNDSGQVGSVTTDTSDALIFTPAVELVDQLSSGDLSAREVMGAFQKQIGLCNPKVNAICTMLPQEQLFDMADAADGLHAAGAPLGPLHGLPIAVKDLSATQGMRTTMGSPIFSDNVPAHDSLLVQRLRRAGALIIGKTNTPEFGAGSHTFNPVFGVTRNPYDLDKTAGGSSGGAAAALACGMLPLADGSDMGGSLRNPAAYCNVVGFRPSMGRVPNWPNPMAWQSRMGTEGPMARTVSDCALLLSVLAGPDERDPMSIQESAAQFRQTLDHDFSGAVIGWSADLGLLPVEKEIRDICQSSLEQFTNAGFRVEEACPDLAGAMDVFKVLRASFYGQLLGSLLDDQGHLMKATLKENIELGQKLSGADLTAADARRTQLYLNFLDFFRHHDFLVLPTTQVQPFDVNTEWVTTIAGQTLENYLDWMSICCMITIFDLPAISVPCGFTTQGLPVGLQIVGRPRADLEVLRAAYTLEQATGYALRHPSP